MSRFSVIIIWQPYINLIFLSFKLFMKHFRSSALANISPFVMCSLQLIFCILLQHHVSNANNLFFCFSNRPHICLIKFFWMLVSMLLEMNRFFFLLNTRFVWFILLTINFLIVPSVVIKLPRYLYSCTYLLQWFVINCVVSCNVVSRSSTRLLHSMSMAKWYLFCLEYEDLGFLRYYHNNY